MRWMDMDAFAHVNNSAYLAYLEEARIAMFFDRYDASFAKGTVIARHEIEYLRPIVYHHDGLTLEAWVDDIRAASFTVHYEVYDRGALASRASTTCVTYDFETARPRRFTAEERVVLESFSDETRDGAALGPR
jgi:acyl-CoA thioester hydrolase